MPDLPWPLPDRTDLRDQLLAAYSTDRGYHDLVHLGDVLERIAELGGGDDIELVLAAWFHDAVYDGARDDEERSAQLAETELAGSGVDVSEVVRLIRMTSDHQPGVDDEAGQVLSDADLGILAADRARYADYVAGVRRDYAELTDEEFRAGRRAVLEELAAREALFHTEYANRHWDAAARANIAAELSGLSVLSD